jgi:hypothetical protein
MKLVRRSRVVAALIALMSILFAQMAVAAYACPDTQPSQGMTSDLEYRAAAEQRHSPDCEELDSESPSLCHAHGQVGKQSLDKPPVPNVAPFGAMTLLVAIVRNDARSFDGIRTIDPFTLRRTTAPPLSIRNCCFRI